MKQPLNKAQLRQVLLTKRRSLSQSLWRSKSEQICAHLVKHPLFVQSRNILSYFSFRQEPDLSFLHEHNRNWGYSRCVGTSLVWHSWQPGDKLETGAYGIPEPHPQSPTLSPDSVDLILVPAVACDRQGYRLGYGGGFYDRMLSNPAWRKIPTIGIVFDFAHLAQLPSDPWDQPLHDVCTDSSPQCLVKVSKNVR